jgi:hypothetical protein
MQLLDRHLVLLVGFAAALGGCEQNSSPAPGRVEWAVELPPTIASELADYVNMEFGGMPGYPIDANNLSYVASSRSTERRRSTGPISALSSPSVGSS